MRDCEKPKGEEDQSETVSSGHERTDALMDSQQLELPTQDPHKTKPVNTPAGECGGVGAAVPAPEAQLLPDEPLTVDGFHEGRDGIFLRMWYVEFNRADSSTRRSSWLTKLALSELYENRRRQEVERR